MKKYLRQKDLAIRYNVSAQHIYNLIKSGKLPPPMEYHGIKLWPAELMDKIDSEKNKKYFEGLADKWK